MAPKKQKKRLGKKHRQASTRPKLGRTAPRATATTGAVAPKKRKDLAAKKKAALIKAKTPTRSPENERRRVIGDDAMRPQGSEAYSERGHGGEQQIPSGNDKKKSKGTVDSERQKSKGLAEPDRKKSKAPVDPEVAEKRAWRNAEEIATTLTLAATGAASEVSTMPLVAICGRPNVGKSTLFNKLTQTRRSIVGDEPGITRDRIYGEVEWGGRDVRLVDTGGVIPDDEALIPAEIFRQAQVALGEANAIVMVVDGRTELASPDMELARLLLRGGKPVFLAVNKMDTPELLAGAENFRRLGFKNVLAISAEHGSGIGDLLDEVWAALPPETVAEEPTENEEGFEEEFEEDMDGGGDPLAEGQGDEPAMPGRRLRSHGEHVARETKVAIIGRPNVGKSTLLNAFTGTERAIVSPIAGTTRDAVDEVVERDGHSFRFIDTAGIRRKGKTKLMAEKLSVIMSRKHLEDADVALLVIDAAEGVAAADANIGGYAHESGRSVIIIVNKWDLMTTPGPDGKRAFDGGPIADKKVYEEQVRDALKYLDYAPLLFVSAEEGVHAKGGGIEEVFKKVELVSRERRKRVSTGAMNRFLDKIDFQRASVPMKKRIRIYYMTQAAVAPPTFVLFTDRDVKLHFSYERFLANEIRGTFKFIGSPIWFKVKARNKKKEE